MRGERAKDAASGRSRRCTARRCPREPINFPSQSQRQATAAADGRRHCREWLFRAPAKMCGKACRVWRAAGYPSQGHYTHSGIAPRGPIRATFRHRRALRAAPWHQGGLAQFVFFFFFFLLLILLVSFILHYWFAACRDAISEGLRPPLVSRRCVFALLSESARKGSPIDRWAIMRRILKMKLLFFVFFFLAVVS